MTAWLALGTILLFGYLVWLLTHLHHGTVESRELEREATRNRQQITCMWCGRFMMNGAHGNGICGPTPIPAQAQQSPQPVVVHVHQAWQPPTSPPVAATYQPPPRQAPIALPGPQ